MDRLFGCWAGLGRGRRGTELLWWSHLLSVGREEVTKCFLCIYSCAHKCSIDLSTDLDWTTCEIRSLLSLEDKPRVSIILRFAQLLAF